MIDCATSKNMATANGAGFDGYHDHHIIKGNIFSCAWCAKENYPSSKASKWKTRTMPLILHSLIQWSNQAFRQYQPSFLSTFYIGSFSGPHKVSWTWIYFFPFETTAYKFIVSQRQKDDCQPISTCTTQAYSAPHEKVTTQQECWNNLPIASATCPCSYTIRQDLTMEKADPSI